jgi:hypothetical protein
LASTVPVHRGQQDLTGPKCFEPVSPLQGFQRGGLSAPIDHHGESARIPPDINRGNHTLDSKAIRQAGDQRRITHGSSIHRDLVRPRPQNGPRIGHRPDSSPHGKGDEYGFGHPADHLEGGSAGLRAGRNIQEHQLIGPFGIVAGSLRYRIAGVAQVLEVNSFNNSSGSHIQTRDDSPR